jgi:hypothetical protein
MIKFPKEIKLKHTKEQADFAVAVAAELTRIRGSRHAVPARTAWRLFNDCCRANPAFFWEFISTSTKFSTDKDASA